MDAAVGLVDAYLQVNGFLTVTEYPILERAAGRTREVTDVDVLAVRLPQAGRVLPRPGSLEGPKMDTHAPLDIRFGRGECIIAEVKEGMGGMNPAMWRKAVLFEAMRRFGVMDRPQLHEAVDALHRTGAADVAGMRVRLVSFARTPALEGPPHLHIPLASVVSFLEGYVGRYNEVNNRVRFRGSVLGLLSILRRP